jgi:two-component system, OmpR family, alkaline phosphatase synthesis response regulator PhoP
MAAKKSDSPTSKLKKVLIAEDEKPMAKALDIKFRKSGFEVLTVFDGKMALDVLLKTKDKFDILLLDLMMPGVDGFEVMEKLNAANIKIPIIVLSNLSQTEDMAKCKALGAADFCVKSDSPISEIVEKVRKILKV